MTLLDRVVEALDSTAVLRHSLILVRGRTPESILLVSEGVDDAGIWLEWARRALRSESFSSVPAAGKSQVLGLFAELTREGSELLLRTAFLVDRDCDGTRGIVGARLFATDRYSVENYFVDEALVRDLLLDEYRCALDDAALNAAMTAFTRFLASARAWLAEPCAIFCAGVSASARMIGKPDRLHNLGTLDLDGLTGHVVWSEHIRFDPQPLEADVLPIHERLANDPSCSQLRGKWLFSAVKRWLAILHEDRCAERPRVFGAQQRRIGQSPSQMSLRSFAGRSPLPANFGEFLTACA